MSVPGACGNLVYMGIGTFKFFDTNTQLPNNFTQSTTNIPSVVVQPVNDPNLNPLSGNISTLLSKFPDDLSWDMKITVTSGVGKLGSNSVLLFRFQQPGGGSQNCELVSLPTKQGSSFAGSTLNYGQNFFPTTISVVGAKMNSDIVCDNPDQRNMGTVSNFNANVTINFTLSINCSDNILQSQTCQTYCKEITQQGGDPCCVDYYNNVCFKNTDVPDTTTESTVCLNGNGFVATSSIPTSSLFSVSQSCTDFYRNYTSEVGPEASIDDLLDTYCQNKYSSIRDFNERADMNDLQLCACHLNPQQYQNFANALSQIIPGLSELGIPNACLFSKCASNGIKTTAIGKKCPIPQCINVAVFNNNGTFNRSNVNINQSGACAKLFGNNNNNNNNSDIQRFEQFFDKYYFAIFSIIAIIFIIIFVLILVL